MLPVRMCRIIDGRRWCTWTATLVAHDVYWDGEAWERAGCNRFLYRARSGLYFLVTLRSGYGARHELEPLSVGQAVALYDGPLKVHEVPADVAFPALGLLRT